MLRGGERGGADHVQGRRGVALGGRCVRAHRRLPPRVAAVRAAPAHLDPLLTVRAEN